MKNLAALCLISSVFLLVGCQPEAASNSNGGNTAQDNNMTINLSWTPPTHRINGEPLSGGLMGYEIRYREVGAATFQSITLGEKEPTSYRLTNIPKGEYEVEIAAYDTDGIYSTFVKATQE